MAKYTEEVYEIVNSLTYDNADKTIIERVNLALPQIFNFDFPIWNEEYRQTLERKIIIHYLKKEICDIFGLWQIYLYDRLNLIMPYYNKMYLSTIVEYDMTKEYTHTITDSESNSTTTDNTGNTTIHNNNTINSTNGNKQVDSDIPQSSMNGQDYASFMSDVSGTNEQTTDGNTTNDNIAHSTTTNTKTVTHNESGNNTNISDLIIKYRDSLINIDNLIIEELHDLFMMIY